MAPSFRKDPEELAHAKFAVVACWEGLDNGKCRIKAFETLEQAKESAKRLTKPEGLGASLAVVVPVHYAIECGRY